MWISGCQTGNRKFMSRLLGSEEVINNIDAIFVTCLPSPCDFVYSVHQTETLLHTKHQFIQFQTGQLPPQPDEIFIRPHQPNNPHLPSYICIFCTWLTPCRVTSPVWVGGLQETHHGQNKSLSAVTDSGGLTCDLNWSSTVGVAWLANSKASQRHCPLQLDGVARRRSNVDFRSKWSIINNVGSVSQWCTCVL